jgi:hypothetical protein
MTMGMAMRERAIRKPGDTKLTFIDGPCLLEKLVLTKIVNPPQ